MPSTLLDERVHASRVCLQHLSLSGFESRRRSLAGGTNLQVPLAAVMAQHTWAEKLGKFSGGVATACVHLPKTVLRGHETLRKKQILIRGGANVGDTEFV